jgi:peptide/nickel transport system ATP-binding protein
MPLLDIAGLSLRIPTDQGMAEILSDVSFALERGESIGLVGESGCGKSMTALAIMGLAPDSAQAHGAIRFEGDDLLRTDEAGLCAIRGRRIAMIFQEPMTALNPVMCIGAQIAEGLRLHLHLGRAETEDRARRLLDRVGLPVPRFSPQLYPHQLSGGQRQRVVIAMALACDPDILIADEPTTALDVTIQAQILDLIASVTAETGMALIMITHDLGIVAETTERMLVMYAGRIVEQGPTAEVFARMAHPYTRGLFAASPHAAMVLAAGESTGRVRLAAIPGQVPDPTRRPAGCVFADRCARRTDACQAAIPAAATVGPDHTAACIHPVLDQVPA